MSDEAEVEFFGAHIKVKSARLAALLNGGDGEDVVVVAGRDRELVSPEDRDDAMNVALDGIESGRRSGGPTATGDAAPGAAAPAPGTDAIRTDETGTDTAGTETSGTDTTGTGSPGR